MPISLVVVTPFANKLSVTVEIAKVVAGCLSGGE